MRDLKGYGKRLATDGLATNARLDMTMLRTLNRLRADKRGVAALEFTLVFSLLFIGMLLPIVDLGIAGAQYIGAVSALRDVGIYAQYHNPPDVTNTSGWSLPISNSGYTISTTLMCGTAVCGSSNVASPKWFQFSTTLTLSPLVLTSILCSGSCTKTISYSERFQ